MNHEQTVMDMAADCLPFMLIGVGGAWIRGIRFGFHGVWGFAASCLTAAFSAFLAALALPELGMGQGMVGAVCGVIGYSGGSLLDGMLGRAMRAVEQQSIGKGK